MDTLNYVVAAVKEFVNEDVSTYFASLPIPNDVTDFATLPLEDALHLCVVALVSFCAVFGFFTILRRMCSRGGTGCGRLNSMIQMENPKVSEHLWCGDEPTLHTAVVTSGEDSLCFVLKILCQALIINCECRSQTLCVGS